MNFIFAKNFELMPKNGFDTIGKRGFGFFSTRLPLTSKRVREILSDVENSKKLAEATRAEREGKAAVFHIANNQKENHD